MEIIETDCLVIGAGLAGSAYALQVARAGRRVLVLERRETDRRIVLRLVVDPA